MEDVQDSSRFSSDCLPPEGDYYSREALYAAIKDWAAQRGYAFVTGRQEKRPMAGYRLFLTVIVVQAAPQVL